MRKWIQALKDLTSWGVALPQARRSTALRVRVYLTSPAGTQVHVGELTEEAGEFVFRYAPSFATSKDVHPIPAFPNVHHEYRSPQLFPFFAVRLPPTAREDVRHALERLRIPEEDTLRVLAALSKKGIANPYEFELAEAGS